MEYEVPSNFDLFLPLAPLQMILIVGM